MDEETDQPDRPDTDGVVCARCGAAPDAGTPPATWVCSMENGDRRYLCDACGRAHLRAIEGRLDPAWW
ncbi:hypothetical protein PZB75_21705 [Streptomyces sp. AM 4-1-1]|uniref:hypothetical protein n=1 Tax=Streptomyces sp. AM 4-1-1 TaxID=3028710 RepID=UPI0023B95A5A|nr:hypothetical protein [Streptomyces sp. AM 4-1-1]WEH35743.1 hypothetical protein PZB75_21705 [Streptomyces sp. AM 4-1-1]